MTTVLTESGPVEVSAGPGQVDELWLARPDTDKVSDWTMKPEGLCKGDICMPVPSDKTDEFVRDDRINLAAFWQRMNKPVAHSADSDVWVLGESADDRSTRLESLDAPDFSLPDLDGKLHSLSDFRGKKVFLATWASW